MNYTKMFGWYYKSAADRSPSWSGVRFLYDFLTSKKIRTGPTAQECGAADSDAGDIVQLSFDGVEFSHTLFILSKGAMSQDSSGIYIAAHSDDSIDRSLEDYPYRKARFLHILGAY
jgi:hypothetical protein